MIALIKNFTIFLGHKFDYKTFITGYIGLPVYIISWAGYKLIYKTKVIKSTDVDLYTFKEIYDREEEEGRRKDQEKEERLKSNGKNMEWFYEKFLGNIF